MDVQMLQTIVIVALCGIILGLIVGFILARPQPRAGAERYR